MVVGEKLLMKLLILSKLIEDNEKDIRDLSRETGIRVERLNKLIKELARNYIMEYDGERVFWNPADIPKNLKPWGWTLHHEVVLGSTQDAAKGLGPWHIVLAEYLIEARGRHGRGWKANLGGLWVTISLSVPPEWATLMSIASSIIVAKTLNTLYNIDARIKWPNDIVIGGNKLAGILIEAEAFPGRFIVYVGIGINVNNEPGVKDAIALKSIVGMKPRNQILASLIGSFTRIDKIVEERGKLMKTYREYLDTLGREVVIETTTGSVEGVVEDIEDNGSIVIRRGSRIMTFDPSSVLKLRYKSMT